MRMAFGLVGILVAIGVVVWLMSGVILPYNEKVLKEGRDAKQEAEQLAGIDSSGMRASESITLEAQRKGSRIGSILVTGIVPGGPMETYYGLMRNDVIVAVGGIDIDALANGDEDMAKAVVYEAYQRKQPITVVRDERKINLPTAGGGVTGAGGSVQRQLEGLQRSETH